MSYLEMALQALDRNHEVIQAPPERILLCAECPWCCSNPWTHYPELPSWCSWHFDYLEADNQQCTGWRKGEILPPDLLRNPRSYDLPQVEVMARGETCFQCQSFAPNGGPNPRQGWGRCQERNRGRYGLAITCERYQGAKIDG
jgi:hypothetical protein